ncbi:MAG: DUF1800 domain-containing protein [Pseudomonadota bacterium]
MSAASIGLNRFGYGALYGSSHTKQAELGPQEYLRKQISQYNPSPALIASRPKTGGKAGAIISAIRDARRKRRNAGDENTEGDPREDYRETVRQSAQVFRSDVALRLKTAVQSETPMAERLVHFWANHFAISVRKPGTQLEAGELEFSAIRPHIFGKFSDMLKAASLHPAMLLYLDQFQSVGPNSPFLQRRRRRNNGRDQGLNENLAREIFELHTLGVDGGYSQTDVTQFAHALTGWTIPGIARIDQFAQQQSGGASFVTMAHEPGARQIMGRTYKEGGAEQALAILDDLASHPSTARFIATKLARHFAGDTPPSVLVDRLAADFQTTNGDLASLTRTLIASPEVWVDQPVKYRQPFEWLVSSFRMTGVTNLSDRRIFNVLRELGQVPWQPPSPAGYDDIEGSWAGPDALFRRVELAERIARNVPSDDVMVRAQAAFPGALSDNTRTWLSRAESGEQALGLLLVAPEMMRR